MPYRVFVSCLTVWLLGTSALSAQPCTSQGPMLTVSSQRQGDITAVRLTGLPGSTGLLGIDTGGGPNAGICLDLSPNLAVFPTSIPPSGEQEVLSALLGTAISDTGFQVFGQAVLYDPGYPGGSAFSNGTSITLRPPRLFMLGDQFGTGALASVNPLDGSVDFTQGLPGTQSGSAYDVNRNLVYAGFTTGAINAYDGSTGQQVATFASPYTGAGIRMQLTEDGQYLVARFAGNPFGQRLITLTLPSLNVVLDTNPASVTGPLTLALDPNSTTSWTAAPAAGSIQAIDYITGVRGPVVPVVPALIESLQRLGDRIYVTDTASTVNALDLTTGTAVLATAVALPVSVNLVDPTLLLGPDPVTGADVPYVAGQPAGSNGSRLSRLNPTTLVETAFINRPHTLNYVEVTPDGNFLAGQFGSPSGGFFPGRPAIYEEITPALTVLNTFSTNIAAPAGRAVRIIRSDSLDMAFTAIGPQIIGIPVNPVGPPVLTYSILPPFFAEIRSIFTD